MSILGIIYIILFIAVFVVTFIFANDFLATTIIGLALFSFGVLGMYEEGKFHGKKLLKSPMLLFNLLFLLVGGGIASAPILIHYKYSIENIFNMEFEIVMTFAVISIFILGCLFFLLYGISMSKKDKNVFYENIVGEITNIFTGNATVFFTIKYIYGNVEREFVASMPLSISGNYKIGDSIDIKVNIDNPEQAMIGTINKNY